MNLNDCKGIMNIKTGEMIIYNHYKYDRYVSNIVQFTLKMYQPITDITIVVQTYGQSQTLKVMI